MTLKSNLSILHYYYRSEEYSSIFFRDATDILEKKGAGSHVENLKVL